MNTLGHIFRVSILGESHGNCIGALIDGCPAGLPLNTSDFEPQLARRRGGSQRGTTPRREPDAPLLRAGHFRGRTTGAPLLIEFANTNIDSSKYDGVRDVPRPGHADVVALHKYGGHHDHRGGGHFSGRLTLGLVAAGVVAGKLLPATPQARVVEVGGSSDIEETVRRAMAERDSVGGVIECRLTGLPVGAGEPFFDSVESVLAHALFSIPAVKGVEFGAGFGAARMRGSECNDALVDSDGTTATNNAGGINGGITNGNELVVRVAIKPTSSIGATQRTLNLATERMTDLSVVGRHDACIALRAPVVVESVVSIVMVDLLRRSGHIPAVWDVPGND